MTIECDAQTAIVRPFAERLPLKSGAWLAVAMSIGFLVATAYTSAATLIERVGSTDVTKAASGGAWSGAISLQMAHFAGAQIALHIAFGLTAWALAVASAVAWPSVSHKFRRLLVGWFCLLSAAVIAFNALWYPRTLIGAHYYEGMVRTIAGVYVGQVIYGGVVLFGALTVGLAAAQFYRSAASRTKEKALWVAASTASIVCLPMVWGSWASWTVAAAAPEKPNVIVLGIDSLRLSELERFGSKQHYTPQINEFLAGADLFRDTTTPAARTFSSWAAILTGRSPPVTGARCNLTNRKSVAATPTFADVLRGAGYQTVYSTDEVRFANIDHSYGFDEVITPPIGASDFLIGTYNELPLASVFINTRLGQFLFPFSYGNRGVATMFQPSTYLGRIERDLRFDRPTLFIAHLTASHWPYYTSETPWGIQWRDDHGDSPLYRTGLRTADRMFGQLLAMLQRKGALDNAVVIVLSDHGEALGQDSDSLYKEGALVEGLGAPLKMMVVGHGQSVLSPVQYQTLLAFKPFGKAVDYRAKSRDILSPVTVEDIAPTVLDLLGIDPSLLQPSGKSLVGLLSDQGSELLFEDRIRFTETDLAVLPATNGAVDEVATAGANSKFFGIEASTGRVAIRDDFLPLALAYKERSAFTQRNLLAAMPAGPYAHQFLYFDIASGSGRLLLDRPDSGDGEARRLWDALHEHYAGELRQPTRVTIRDWPRIEQEWANFFVDQKKATATAASNAPN